MYISFFFAKNRFNTLVMMTLFNQISSRKLYHEPNLFAGILNNPLFLGILTIEAVAHVVLYFRHKIQALVEQNICLRVFFCNHDKVLVVWGGVIFQTAYDPPIPLIDWIIALGFGVQILYYQQSVSFLILLQKMCIFVKKLGGYDGVAVGVDFCSEVFLRWGCWRHGCCSEEGDIGDYVHFKVRHVRFCGSGVHFSVSIVTSRPFGDSWR